MEHLHSKALALRYSHCPLHSELNFSLLSAPPPRRSRWLQPHAVPHAVHRALRECRCGGILY